MSILIKGIDLPKDFWYLDLVITADGVVRCYGDEDEQIAEAVELPDHGDLVDRGKFVEKDCYGCPYTSCYAKEILDEMPVVIPAERSESDEA